MDARCQELQCTPQHKTEKELLSQRAAPPPVSLNLGGREPLPTQPSRPTAVHSPPRLLHTRCRGAGHLSGGEPLSPSLCQQTEGRLRWPKSLGWQAECGTGDTRGWRLTIILCAKGGQTCFFLPHLHTASVTALFSAERLFGF